MDTIKYQNKKSITPQISWHNNIKRISTEIIIIFYILFMLAPPLLSETTSNNTIITLNIPPLVPFSPQTDLLIILSPSYIHDPEIIHHINRYIHAIHQDINWTSQLITLLSVQNTYPVIDTIIEQIYHANHIKACLLIGDDLDLPIAGTYHNKSKPSIKPFATLGGTNRYQIQNNHIISTPYQTDVFISLLIPNPSMDYQSKKNQIISTLESFIISRTTHLMDTITVLESSDLHINSVTINKTLGNVKQFNYYQDPTTMDILTTLNQSHSLYLIQGHSDPSKTLLNRQNNTWFTINHLKQLETSVFLADGCYVNGYWTTSNNKSMLSSYAHILCENPHIQMMILGILSQTQKTNTSQLQQILTSLSQGKTIAETFLEQSIDGDLIFYGDPTFHFTTQ